jgi:hypothetical protein
MSASHAFSAANFMALGCWVLLIAFPRRAWASRIAGTVIPAAFAVLYTIVIALNFFGSPGGFSSLADVARLFGNPWLLLAGWIHYLTFDLLIGSWEVRDARRRGISHMLVIPCLLLTFMFGPAGWLLYLGVRSRVPDAPRHSER